MKLAAAKTDFIGHCLPFGVTACAPASDIDIAGKSRNGAWSRKSWAGACALQGSGKASRHLL
jgi:hypothetical protein